MTRIPTNSPPGSKSVRRWLRGARLLAVCERIWPLLWPAGGIAAGFLALAWSGVLPRLPWPLHALILAATVTALGLSLYFAWKDLSWPSPREAARKLERDSGFAHRPLSEADDTLAAGAGDPVAEALWAARSQRLPPLGRLRLHGFRSGMAHRDPYRLRYVVAALTILVFFAAWGHWGDRFVAAFGPAGYETPSLDAWIDPPAYTGRAPVYLNAVQRVTAPAGSVLNVRVHGAGRAPFLSLQRVHIPWLPFAGRRLSGKGGEYAADTTLTRNAQIRVRAIGRTIGNWRVDIIPDQKPKIAFTAPPVASGRSALRLAFAADDDYGVTAVRALIRPADGKGETLSVDLQVPAGKHVHQTVYRDLTSHPYAGLEVDIVLEATDAAKQTGRTAPMRMKLPQLVFVSPLARALVEQRRILAHGGLAARAKVTQAIDALTEAPELFYAREHGMYLALRNVFWALKFSKKKEDLAYIETLLWQAAVSLEHGGMLPLAENLRQIERALAQLMASGAPQEEVDAMLRRYAQAMDAYLRALGADGNKAAEEKSPEDDKAKTLDEKDLADLLSAIQTLTQSGDRERAAQLLGLLQNMLENMHVAEGGGASSGADRRVQDLSDLAGRQRQLMDKTFRQSQGTGNPADGGRKGLAQQQQALKNEMSKLRKDWKDAPKALGEAEKQMNEAGRAIRLGDYSRAGTLQKYALDALRKGAGELARNGKDGQANAKPGGNTDPFGRAGSAGTEGVPVPDSMALKRARDILEELRRKAGELGRPKEERDYIERLLKQF